jgi:hypothetical protein
MKKKHAKNLKNKERKDLTKLINKKNSSLKKSREMKRAKESFAKTLKKVCQRVKIKT